MWLLIWLLMWLLISAEYDVPVDATADDEGVGVEYERLLQLLVDLVFDIEVIVAVDVDVNVAVGRIIKLFEFVNSQRKLNFWIKN